MSDRLGGVFTAVGGAAAILGSGESRGSKGREAPSSS
jgi:hypothetical protein